MNGISHKQAIQLLNRRIDGLLSESERLFLDEHLRSCDSCRAYAVEMDGFSAHLQNEFHRRWDTQPGPSQNVFAQVVTEAGKIPMTKRLASGAKLFAGAVALIVLGIAVNFVISRLQSTSPATNATETAAHTPAESRLLAFASDQSGNLDIYTVRADGSDLTNLTNHPANDSYPIWSPDGKHIAFESDRDGFRQIYLINADGSNLARLTNEEADHGLPLSYDGKYNPWSPDGSKLVFVQEDAGGETAAIYSVDVNGQNKVKLFDGKNLFGFISWSPDGNHIAFILNDSPTPRETYVPDIYIVDSDGNQLRELQSFLPEGETLAFTPYYWSSNGQSIVFTSYTVTNGLPRQTLYEFDVITNTFSNRIEIRPDVVEWKDGIALRIEVNQDAMPYVWERPDGTTQTFEESKAWGETCSLDSTRSFEGNYAFGVYCPHDKFNVYWTNADGSTIKKILTLPVDLSVGGVGDIAWSPDEQYIAFNLTTPEKTEMYVLKVQDALANPSIEPLKLPVSSDEGYRIPSWQPVITEDIAREVSTPQPTPIPLSTGLLAFTSDQSGNFDIYTMRADGSGLTNLTNHPANDSKPVWSPDGKHIAFESDRDGFNQIYIMDADGSNLIQLTKDEANHSLPLTDSQYNPWSPDGSKLLLIQEDPGAETATLYSIHGNGEGKTMLAHGKSPFNSVSWSLNGNYVAFVLNSSMTPQENFEPAISIVDSDGNQRRELESFLPEGETLAFTPYYWSSNRQSIIFTSYRSAPLRQTLYEFDVITNTFINQIETKPDVVDWRDGITLRVDANQEGLPYMWEYPDRTVHMFEESKTWGSSCSLNVSRSPDGYFAFGVYCPYTQFDLYWTTPDGSSIQHIFDSPIDVAAGGVGEIVWSPDEQYLAFNLESLGKTDMYILNIEEARTNPSISPVQIPVSNSELYMIPSWQQVTTPEIVEEELVPEPTQAPPSESLPPIGTGKGNGEWIAFIGGKAVPDPLDPAVMMINQDVYLIHPDGSGLSNLTNLPAHYLSLQWSPNGKDLLFLRSSGYVDILRKTESGVETLVNTVMHIEKPFEYGWSPNSEQIAFVDNRAGDFNIYTVYADGRSDPALRQLTDDPGQDFGFVWSPEGSQIAYQNTRIDNLSIMVMNADGSDQHEVAKGTGKVTLQWSQDGTAIYASSTGTNRLECEGCVAKPGIYRIDLDNPSVHQIYYETDADQISGWYMYETSQNTLYFMRINKPTFVEFWGTWFRADGSSVTEIGEMDPQQTCKTTTGNILNESISPNPRFSVISNFCAGGFDLYLADREAAPEKRFTHLLQLPLDTWGQGGDSATLPIGWSPDGRWLIYEDGHGTINLLDIEKAIQNPEATLVPLIELNSLTGPDGQLYSSPETLSYFGLVWQPRP